MKTRTLLLLALACGLAIMGAGAVLLFRLSTQDPVAPASVIGEDVEVGDMIVRVVRARANGDELVVDVEIGGVADADGGAGFRLIAAGRPLQRLEGDAATSCEATTVAVQPCAVRFDVAGVDGESRVLFYERGDDRARWVLA